MKKDNGVTLVELMIALVLAIFVLSLAFFIFSKQFKYSVVFMIFHMLDLALKFLVNLWMQGIQVLIL